MNIVNNSYLKMILVTVINPDTYIPLWLFSGRSDTSQPLWNGIQTLYRARQILKVWETSDSPTISDSPEVFAKTVCNVHSLQQFQSSSSTVPSNPTKLAKSVEHNPYSRPFWSLHCCSAAEFSPVCLPLLFINSSPSPGVSIGSNLREWLGMSTAKLLAYSWNHPRSFK